MGIIIPIMIFMIPIIAIISGTYIKNQELKLKNLEQSPVDKETILQLKQAVEDNEALQERVKNLEYIITSMDESILQLHAADRMDDAADKVTKLADKIKKTK